MFPFVFVWEALTKLFDKTKMPVLMEKICSRCNLPRPVTSFQTDNSKKDKVRQPCSDCRVKKVLVSVDTKLKSKDIPENMPIEMTQDQRKSSKVIRLGTLPQDATAAPQEVTTKKLRGYIEPPSMETKIQVCPDDFGEAIDLIMEKYGKFLSITFQKNGGCRLSIHGTPQIIFKAKTRNEVVTQALAGVH